MMSVKLMFTYIDSKFFKGVINKIKSIFLIVSLICGDHYDFKVQKLVVVISSLHPFIF